MVRSALPLSALGVALAAMLLTTPAFAAEDAELEPAGNEVGNIASLQRGARNYMNYCSGCHSAKYVRYNRLGAGLMISEEQIIENLMFNAEKTFETIEATMSTADAETWFGRAPPDLSLMARAKGTDYIYNFLKGFYLDPDSPTGVNNLYLDGAGMPHVLWELQGYQQAVYDEVETETGAGTRPVFSHFESVTTGTLSPEEYDEFVRDTVNFLEYISEPMRATRRILGVWVLIFLTVFLIIASMLKKQIWKDVS